jgi:hypothetical protein
VSIQNLIRVTKRNKCVTATNISLAFTTPSNADVPMTMEAVGVPGQAALPPLPMLSLGKGDEVTLLYSFFNGNFGLIPFSV